MHLNPEWENMPPEYDFAANSFQFKLPSAGINSFLNNESYMQFYGAEGINMMSMVFCRRGGIISAEESGQKNIFWEDIFTDLEKELLEKFSMDFAYENWSKEKQKCAEAIWQKFYVEEGYSAYVVAGLIGNMAWEGQCGQLQYADWNQSWNTDNICISGMIITKIEQARVACLLAPKEYGIGMSQWSDPDRKKILFQNYLVYQSDDGTLNQAQLIEAEIDTIYTELTGKFYNNKVIETCNRFFNNTDNANNTDDNITYATCVLIREYEIPQGYEDVDSKTYKASEDIWINAKNAEKIDDVHTVCKRIIAAKIAYEQFMQ